MLPVLRVVYSNLRVAQALPGEFHRAVNGIALHVLNVAELCSAALALVQAHLTDFSAPLEE